MKSLLVKTGFHAYRVQTIMSDETHVQIQKQNGDSFDRQQQDSYEYKGEFGESYIITVHIVIL